MAGYGQVDEAAIHELFTADDGPAAGLVRELAVRGADIARELVPRRSGHMMETITSGTDHDPFTGAVRGWFGAGYEAPIPFGRAWAGGFPVINALQAKSGFVWNRSPAGSRHVRGTRGTEPFLTGALDALAGEV